MVGQQTKARPAGIVSIVAALPFADGMMKGRRLLSGNIAGPDALMMRRDEA